MMDGLPAPITLAQQNVATRLAAVAPAVTQFQTILQFQLPVMNGFRGHQLKASDQYIGVQCGLTSCETKFMKSIKESNTYEKNHLKKKMLQNECLSAMRWLNHL